MNKEDYLNRVLEFLVEDTIIDLRHDMVKFPFTPKHTINYKYKKSDLYEIFNNMLSGYDTHKNQFDLFYDYCYDNYGLTNDDDIIVLWGLFQDKIVKLLSQKITVNESEDRRTTYLNKILNFLVDDTEIGNNWFSPSYYYPGSTSGRISFESVYLHTFNRLSDTSYSGMETQLIYFRWFCRDTYGLTEDEISILWPMYMERIYELKDWGF